MPGLDRTGPEGQGSRTGRQMGRCASKPEESNTKDAAREIQSGESERWPGRGFGRGRGLGRGLGRGSGRGRGRGIGGG